MPFWIHVSVMNEKNTMTELVSEEKISTDFAVREHRSLWLDAWRRLISNRTAILGLIIVVLFLLSSIGAHFFWHYDPMTDLDYGAKLLAPNLVKTAQTSQIHIFGTDKLGRDIFQRVVHGGWNSLRVGIIAVSISLIVGGILGLLAGFFESTNLNRSEQTILMAVLGLACGALPAWLVNQAYVAALFMLLGMASAWFQGFLKDRPKTRTIFFGLIGMLLGGISGLLVAPLVGLVSGIAGFGIGILLAKPIKGQTFSSVTMRIMDIILSFPSYLLAIAIVAFLGPGLEKGMIAIGFVAVRA